MLIRILVIWFIANFLIVGIVSWLVGEWYLGWPPAIGWLAELILIMLPNILLPVFALRYWRPEQFPSLRDALGWRWCGWPTLIVGLVGLVLVYVISTGIASIFGSSIPYQTPGVEGVSAENLSELLGLLLMLCVMVIVTVVGEETMFRGLTQTQVGIKYAAWVGLLVGALLFGLRHLPADFYYARLWDATPQMWLTRQLQLYSVALVLGGVRYIGRSTYASALAHGLYFFFVLFGIGG